MSDKPQKAKSKSIVCKELAEHLTGKIAKGTELKPKDVATIFEGILEYVQKELGKKGPGVVSLPGLVKVTKAHKKATKGGTRPSPFDPSKMIIVKPKPARTTVKVRPLKNLKDVVA